MPAVKYQVPADHAILSVSPHHFHVHSDNAMIDSGSGFIVYCWDRTNRKPAEFRVHTGRQSCGPDDTWDVEPDVTATEDDRREAAAHAAASGFVREVLGAAEEAHYIRQGTEVEVVKGRKCPKGRYEVADHRKGNYGPYINLRTADGKWYNYVSVDNVRPVPDYQKAFASHRAQRDLAAFLAKVAEAGFTETAWGVLADYIEEHEVRILEGRAVSVGAFADALRRVTRGGTKLSTYRADCHNEFRRPFGGR